MIESFQIYRQHAQAQGHKGLRSTLGCSLSHTYVLTTPSEARDTQVRDDLERIVAMVEASASRGKDGEVANEMTEVFFSELFNRTNRGDSPKPLTCERAITEAQVLCQHFADVLGTCKPGFVPEEVTIEAAEMIVALRNLIRCAEAADDGNSEAEGLRLPARLRA
jgi:hypothetical protein